MLIASHRSIVPADRPHFGSVVHINEKGGRFGGTEEYIDLITPALAAVGVRSHLICGRLVAEVPDTMATTTVISGLASRSTSPNTAAALVEAIERLDPDVIYLHNLFDPLVVEALAASVTRAVIVWYVHDHYLTCLSELRWRRDRGACDATLGTGCLDAIADGHCVMRNPASVVTAADLDHRRTLSATLRRVDHVVVVSEYMRGLLIDAEPDVADRIHCMTRPIRDLGTAPARARRPSDPAVITFAGRITPEKGLDILIEALMNVRTTAPIELRIAGVVEHEAHWAQCQQLARRASAQNARLQITPLGHLDYAATDELFRSSDIVAIPSQWPEPLGCVALEAMSAGAAVIASDIGGLANTIRHIETGLLVKPDDVGTWAAAVDALLDDPEQAERFGRAAQRQARRHTTDSHVYALRHIVSKGKASPLAPVTGRRLARAART